MKIKTLNQLNKIKNHIKNKVFGLKDYDKTFNKYCEYKPKMVNDFFIEFENEIKDFLDYELKENLNIEMNFNNMSLGYINTFKKSSNLNKSQINQFKTLINNLTYKINIKFIKNLGFNLNDNELRNLTIIFYLRNYDKINKVMVKQLQLFYKKNFEVLKIDNQENFKIYLEKIKLYEVEKEI